MTVVVVLAASSAVSGAVGGFVLGLAFVPLVVPVPVGATWVCAAALVLDGFRVPPLSVRRQVPQLWGRLFSARVTALLYGARLGVGPLTVLRTWWWWAAAVLGGMAGVWWSVVVGAVFGLGRVVVMVAVRDRAPRWWRLDRPVALVGGVVVLVVAAVAVSAGGGGGLRDRSPALEGSEIGIRSLSPPNGPTDPPALQLQVVDDGLAALLPAEIGTGWQRLADDPLDLAAAARAEDDVQAERSLLETRRFVAGHARAWRAPDTTTTYAAVYRFATADGAAAYLVDGMTTVEARGGRAYDLSAPVGARGFSQPIGHGVAFVRGDRFFLIARSAPATPDDAAAVARAVDAWQSTHSPPG